VAPNRAGHTAHRRVLATKKRMGTQGLEGAPDVAKVRTAQLAVYPRVVRVLPPRALVVSVPHHPVLDGLCECDISVP